MTLTAAGLTNGGVTAHYQFQYDDSLSPPINPGGPEPARTNAVIASCEDDFKLMSVWFDNVGLDIHTPIPVYVTQNSGGASWHRSGNNLTITINPNNGVATFIRYLLVSEMVEQFMRAQGKGWFGSGTEGSQGEGLSRFLGAQFLASNGLGNPPAGFANSNAWLSSSRADFINNINLTDDGPDAATGCSLLFLYWLYSQLGYYTIRDIAAAGAPTLRGVYRNLTGDTSDPFPIFKQLLDLAFPGTSTIRTGNLDNPFPIDAAVDGILLQGYDAFSKSAGGPIWVVYGRARFQIPDQATLSRLFPNVPINYDANIFSVSTIPVDGTLLREESSSQVYIIEAGRKAIAPPGVAGQVHVLWDRALTYIPFVTNLLTGVVTDQTTGTPIDQAVILITSVLQEIAWQFSTDAAGSYAYPAIPVGVYDVEVSASGFETAHASVTVLNGVAVTIQNFALTRTLPFTIKGEVTDTTGTQIVGATVRLAREDSLGSGFLETQTNSSGSYSITMDPGSYDGNYVISANVSGFMSGEITMTVPNGATITQNFALVKEAILKGVVTDTAGTLLVGVTVTVGSVSTQTDSTGQYSILITPGDYDVSAMQLGFVPGHASVPVSNGVPIVTQNFALVKAVSGTITGTVINGLDGTPMHFIYVSAASVSTKTDFDGNYTLSNVPPTLSNVPPGPTEVRAIASGGFLPGKQSVTVLSGQTITVDFTLTTPGPHPPVR